MSHSLSTRCKLWLARNINQQRTKWAARPHERRRKAKRSIKLIPLTLTGIFTAIVLGLCFSQKQLSRQHAGFVYGSATAFHFLLSSYLELSWPAYSWEIYYLSAALFAWLVFEVIHRMPLYSIFHERLKIIAGCWVVVNFLGFCMDLADQARIVYYILSFTLYMILIVELWIDGRPARILEDRSLLRHFRANIC